MALKMINSGVAHCQCDRFQECHLELALVDEMPKYCPFDGKKADWWEVCKKKRDDDD